MARFNEEAFQQILSKPGYGLASGITSGIKSAFKREETLHKARGERAVSELESGPRPKSISPKELTIPNSGRCAVSIKVYRRRLTDTGNDAWKYHLDACRYLGLLEDDNDAKIILTEEPHEKVETNEEERVEITLTYQGIDMNDLIEYYKDGPKNQHHGKG